MIILHYIQVLIYNGVHVYNYHKGMVFNQIVVKVRLAHVKVHGTKSYGRKSEGRKLLVR